MYGMKLPVLIILKGEFQYFEHLSQQQSLYDNIMYIIQAKAN